MDTSFTEHAHHTPRSPMRGCAREKIHSPRQHQGYMFGLFILVSDYFILSLGFRSQDNYLPRDRKGYESYNRMIDPISVVLVQISVKPDYYDLPIDQIGPLQPPV